MHRMLPAEIPEPPRLIYRTNPRIILPLLCSNKAATAIFCKMDFHYVPRVRKFCLNCWYILRDSASYSNPKKDGTK